MSLFRTSFLGALDFVVRAASVLILLKLAAHYAGSEGVGYFGQFQNLISILLLLSGGIFSTAIIRFTAENQKNTEFLTSFWSTAIFSSVLLACVCAIGTILLSFTNVYDMVLPDLSRGVVLYSALFLIPASLQSFLFSASNGLENPKLLLSIRIASVFILIITFLFLVLNFEFEWALLSLTLAPALTVLIGVFIFLKNNIFKNLQFNISASRKHFKILFQYGFTSTISALTLPVILLMTRSRILAEFGPNELGNWEGAFRIGDQYLILISSILTLYYLPKFAKEKDNLNKIVREAFLFSLILSSLGGAFIYFLRTPVVTLLLSSDFILTVELLGVQIATSVIKICAWVFAFVMITRAQHKLFIAGEVGTSLLLITLVFYFSTYSIHWVNYSFLFVYPIYLAYCYFVYYFTYLRSQKDSRG